MRYDYGCILGHVTEIDRHHTKKPKTTKCAVCGKRARPLVSRISISGSGLGVKGSPSGAYWPSKGIAQERVIENLGHRPVTVGSKAEYRKLLEKTNTREVG
jgi:hypothetical protein